MSALRRLTRSARRRLLWRDFARTAGPALAAGAATGLGLVILERVLGVAGGVPWPVLVAAPPALALAGAGGVTLARRKSTLEAAAAVDRALGLRDRLSNGVAFVERPGAAAEDPFVSIAVAEAERAAAESDVRRAVRVRLDWTWALWPVLSAAAVGAGFVLPAWHLLRDERGATPEILAAQQTEREQLAEELERAAETVAPREDGGTVDAATAERLRTLEELREQLASGTTDPEEARRRAAGSLEELARGLERDAESAQRTGDALRRRLARSAGGGGPNGERSALSRALREGDLNEAAAAAQELLGEAEGMTPEERAELADSLEQLARDIEEAERRAAEEEAARRAQEQGAEEEAGGGGERQAERDLREQGVPPETARDLAQRTDPDEIQRELEERGVDPAAARQLAERIAEENRQRQAEEEAQRRAEELKESLRDAAEDLRDGPREQRGNQQQQQQQPGQGQQRPGQQGQGGQPQGERGGQGERQPGESGEQQERQGSSPGARSPEGERSSQSGERQGESGEQREGGQGGGAGEQGEGERQGGQQQSGEQPGRQQGAGGEQQGEGEQSGEGQQPGQGEQSGQGQQPGSDPQSGEGSGGEQPGGGQPGGQQPGGQQPGGGQQQQQGEQPGQRPGGKQQGDGQQPGQGRRGTGQQPGEQSGTGQGEGGEEPRGVEGLAERLKRMQRAAEQAKRDRQAAERLREQAREMMEKATPEQREEMERWAQQMAKEMGEQQQQPNSGDGGEGEGGRGSQAGRGGAGQGPESGQPRRPGDRGAGDGFRSEAVDARPKGPGAEGEDPNSPRVVAEWLGDGKPGERIERDAAAARLVEAARSAERAVEERTVPGRYDSLIRRYFRRLPERVLPAEEVKPAQDAGK